MKTKLVPWPIDSKCFTQDIVSDFVDSVAYAGSAAYGTVGRGIDAIAFYAPNFYMGSDELMEMRWAFGWSYVIIRSFGYLAAKKLAYRYAKWVQDCEDCNHDGHPYKCVIEEDDERQEVIVKFYKEVDD